MWDSEEEFRSLRGKIEANDLAMNDAGIWAHTHRMYLIGENSIHFPWFIPKDFPRDALAKKDRETFMSAIDEINPKLRFSTCERWTFYVLSFVFPPGA